MGPTADWQQPALGAAREEICSLPTECQGKSRGLQLNSMAVHFIQACLEIHDAILAVGRIIGDLVMVDSLPPLKELVETSAPLRPPDHEAVKGFFSPGRRPELETSKAKALADPGTLSAAAQASMSIANVHHLLLGMVTRRLRS